MTEGKKAGSWFAELSQASKTRTYQLKHPRWGLEPWEQVRKSGPCSSCHWQDFIHPWMLSSEMFAPWHPQGLQFLWQVVTDPFLGAARTLLSLKRAGEMGALLHCGSAYWVTPATHFHDTHTYAHSLAHPLQVYIAFHPTTLSHIPCRYRCLDRTVPSSHRHIPPTISCRELYCPCSQVSAHLRLAVMERAFGDTSIKPHKLPLWDITCRFLFSSINTHILIS